MTADLHEALANTKRASRTLAQIPPQKINEVLLQIAVALLQNQQMLLEANEKDLARKKKDDPQYDRLQLSPDRLSGIAADIRTVTALPSPLDLTLEEKTLPNGLHLQKISVPLGVIGMIYEARPNVTVDAFSLCFKSGNACVLKGGSDATASNDALVGIMHDVLRSAGIDPSCLSLLPPDRSSVDAMLHAHGLIDVIIPRGGQGLIDFVRENATVPVIETGAGIVHTYVDASADLTKAAKILFNEKTVRPSVCNALDTLLIHRDRLNDLPAMLQGFAEKLVEVFADPAALKALEDHYDPTLLHPAKEEHFGTEFLSLKMSIKTVADLNEAIAHIEKHSSRHSEAIVAEDQKVIEEFLRRVDAAAVYANASTYFTDGAQFGMGAEIGISTQKLHVRGPMGLKELTSYKWVVRGNGQVRN